MFNATQFYSLFFWLFFFFLYIQHDNNKKKCNRNWVCTNFFLSLSIAMCPGKLLSKFIKSTMGNGSLNGNNSKKKKTNLFLSFRLFYGFYSCYKIACKLQVIISNRPFPCWTYSFFFCWTGFIISIVVCIHKVCSSAQCRCDKEDQYNVALEDKWCRLVPFPYSLHWHIKMQVCNSHLHVGQLCNAMQWATELQN